MQQFVIPGAAGLDTNTFCKHITTHWLWHETGREEWGATLQSVWSLCFPLWWLTLPKCISVCSSCRSLLTIWCDWELPPSASVHLLEHIHTSHSYSRVIHVQQWLSQGDTVYYDHFTVCWTLTLPFHFLLTFPLLTRSLQNLWDLIYWTTPTENESHIAICLATALRGGLLPSLLLQQAVRFTEPQTQLFAYACNINPNCSEVCGCGRVEVKIRRRVTVVSCMWTRTRECFFSHILQYLNNKIASGQSVAHGPATYGLGTIFLPHTQTIYTSCFCSLESWICMGCVHKRVGAK